MNADAIVLSTISFDELPLHFELQEPSQALRPSSIEEYEDDPRSLLYLFDDNDFEQAAAFLAIDEARHQAQVEAAAEALIEAESERQRVRALADRLRRLLDEDDELVDMLGRRILATNGHQVPDLWHPHYYHHHRHDPFQSGFDFRGLSGGSSSAASLPSLARFIDVHAAWEELANQTAGAANPRASPFIHAAPVIQRGQAPYQRTAAQSNSAAPPRSQSTQPQTQARVAIHPLTGVPVLLVEEDVETDKSTASQSTSVASEDSDEWPIDDESDLDWLGRELLRRQGGANVWVLGTDNDAKPLDLQSISSAMTPPSTRSTSAASSAKQPEPTPLLPSHVEEADSDHDRGGANWSHLSSPSQRVAAALAQAALHTPSGEQKPSPTAAKPTTRQRAATVMSESEEEELETVGKPVEDDQSTMNDRPRKSVKVVDLRSS